MQILFFTFCRMSIQNFRKKSSLSIKFCLMLHALLYMFICSYLQENTDSSCDKYEPNLKLQFVIRLQYNVTTPHSRLYIFLINPLCTKNTKSALIYIYRFLFSLHMEHKSGGGQLGALPLNAPSLKYLLNSIPLF